MVSKSITTLLFVQVGAFSLASPTFADDRIPSPFKIQSWKVSVQPWSGDYWPNYRGGIAFPYADTSIIDPYKEIIEQIQLNNPEAPVNRVFIKRKLKESFEENLQNRLNRIQKLFQSRLFFASDLETLSPTEKVDLFFEDLDFTFTKSLIPNNSKAKLDNDRHMPVDVWTGICDGWTAASVLEKRPTHRLLIPSRRHRFMIPFYPDDIKALYSFHARFRYLSPVVLGERCRKITGSEPVGCNDISAKAFHLFVFNQLGIKKTPFALDIDSDVTVRNQTILGFKFQYFNPLNPFDLKKEKPFLKARTLYADVIRDSVLKNMLPMSASWVAGVQLTLEYLRGVSPSHAETNSSEQDVTRKIVYQYYLLLDENGQITDSVWLPDSDRPDFAWIPQKPPRGIQFSDAYFDRFLDRLDMLLPILRKQFK